MSRLTTAALVAALLSPALALAEGAAPAAPAVAASSAPAPAATPPPPKWYDTFELHGLVDSYYGVNLSQGQAEPNALRAFDAENGFQLAYAKLSLSAAPTDKVPAGFRVDVGLGKVADLVAYKGVQQAYVTLALPKGLTLDLGRFSTPIGAEVIEAKDNLLYSRSILFTLIPFTHTGARLTAPLGVEGLTGLVALTNGWDVPSTTTSANAHKTLLAGLLYAGPSATTVALNLSYGKEPADTKEKTAVDVVLGRTFGDLTLNLNADYVKQDTDTKTGLSGIVRYSLAGDAFRLTGRGEWVQDDPGAGATKTTATEFTLGGSIPFGASSELRVEYRYDHIDHGVLAGVDKKDQSTVQVAALAWF